MEATAFLRPSKSAPGKPALDPKPEVITRRQVRREAEPELRHLARTFNGPELERRGRQAWREAAERLVDRALLVQAAREAGLRASDAEVEACVRRAVLQHRVEDETRLAEILDAQGITLEEFRQACRTQILTSRFLDQAVRPSPPPSPSEILRYYADHVAEFAAPQEVQLRKIVVRKSGFTSRAGAEAHLRQVLSELESGQDFGALARKYSDSPSAGEGGLMPYLPVSSLRHDLADLVEGVAQGRTVAVQDTPDTYEIVRVDGIRQGAPRPSADAQDEILERICRDELSRRRAQVVRDLRRRGHVWLANLG